MTNALSMVAGALLMGSGVWLGQVTQARPRPEPVVSAQRFVLVGSNGAELGNWGVDAEGIVELRMGAAGAPQLRLQTTPQTSEHLGFASLDLLDAKGSTRLSLNLVSTAHHGTGAADLLYADDDKDPVVSLETNARLGTGPALSFWSGVNRIFAAGIDFEGSNPYLNLVSPEAGTNKYSSFWLRGTPQKGMEAVLRGAEGGSVKLSSFKGSAELSLEDVEKVRRVTLP